MDLKRFCIPIGPHGAIQMLYYYYYSYTIMQGCICQILTRQFRVWSMRNGLHTNNCGYNFRFWLKTVIVSLFCSGYTGSACEASSKRVFSHCGDLACGRRNRKKVTLERSVFLKVNRKLFQKVGVTVNRWNLYGNTVGL